MKPHMKLAATFGSYIKIQCFRVSYCDSISTTWLSIICELYYRVFSNVFLISSYWMAIAIYIESFTVIATTCLCYN